MSARVRAGAAALSVGVQLAVLYTPRVPAVDTSGLPWDKLVHVAVFLVPTVALVVAGVPRGLAVGLMAAHAPISEVVQQSALGARAGDALDVVADLVGVSIAAFLTRPGGRFAVRARNAPADPGPSSPGPE